MTNPSSHLLEKLEKHLLERRKHETNVTAWQDKAALVKKLLKNDHAAFFSGHSAPLFRWLDQNMVCLERKALQPYKVPVMKEIEMLFATLNLPDTGGSANKKIQQQCTWMANFNDLILFRKANPTSWPRLNTNKAERKLAHWCIGIRYQYRRKTLNKIWLAKMETLAFNFNGTYKKYKG